MSEIENWSSDVEGREFVWSHTELQDTFVNVSPLPESNRWEVTLKQGMDEVQIDGFVKDEDAAKDVARDFMESNPSP